MEGRHCTTDYRDGKRDHESRDVALHAMKWKETDSSQEPSEQIWSYQHLDFDLVKLLSKFCHPQP